MKKVNIPPQKEAEPIDWSKPQWVICPSGTVILTTGEHTIGGFCGTALPSKIHNNGYYTNTWDKSIFQPLDFEIPFIISNKD